MYTTQPNFWSRSRGMQEKKPYQFYIQNNQIHKVHDVLKKSLRVHRNRPKPCTTKQRRKSHKIQTDKNLNITICKAFIQTPQVYHCSIEVRPREEFQSNTDRVSSMRKRLSPLKSQFKQKITPSSDYSGMQTSFLNIQRFKFTKYYSNAQKMLGVTQNMSFEDRYMLAAAEKQVAAQTYTKPETNAREVQLMKQQMKRGLSSKEKIGMIATKFKNFTPSCDRYYYRDFIWKVAFANGFICKALPQQVKMKLYVGKGNNSQLVRSLINRRSWWCFTEKYQQANLIWTQLKISQFYKQQQPGKAYYESEGLHQQPYDEAKNQLNCKIMSKNDLILWDRYWKSNKKQQQRFGQDFSRRSALLKKADLTLVPGRSLKMQNHLSHNYLLGNKKALYYTMRQYYQIQGKDVFQYLPLTFHVKNGLEDQQYAHFLKRYYAKKKQGGSTVWIVKPGELTNRGKGITVCLSVDQIKSIIKKGGKHWDGSSKTFIIQQYLEKPFLYQGRKFDIRHYILITSINGRVKGYWYKRGYVRTTSSQYTLANGLSGIHLTNDAVQKYLPDYGKYQKGNKLSYQDLQNYLHKQSGKKYDFWEDVYPRMKAIATDAMRAGACAMDPHKLQHNFQLFGLDFLIDANFKPWLIQVNSNPCLQLSCPLLADIIPNVIQNTLRLCVDPLAPPPVGFKQKRTRFSDHALANNQYELVYDSSLEAGNDQRVSEVMIDHAELQKEQDEQFEDDGEALED